MNNRIKKVLVIGSGPVIIGQGSEYDYSAFQVCAAFKEDNISTVLINPNSAAISTDKGVADAVYIEPLNIDAVKRIIETEKPDAVFPVSGGEKALEISIELFNNGFLDESGVEMLSISPENIMLLKSKSSFKSYLEDISEPSVASKIVSSSEAAISFAEEISYPVIVRPAYSLGGSNAEICSTEEELLSGAESALKASLLGQVLVEKCISGWKEFEFETVRDCAGNCIGVCSLENIDPVGIHTGDSIVVVPAQTLTDGETAMLRAAALKIISNLEITGNCNVKFALRPDGGEYAVLGIEPRLGRSSALMSKTTGYPIARVAAKAAIGYKLFEIKNEITGCTTAANEPAIDYCAIKFPKWSFDRFDMVRRTLGTSMQSTGETFAIGTSFELAFMKAVRSINIGVTTPSLPKFNSRLDDEIVETIKSSDDERIFAVYAALKRGVDIGTIYELTKIDTWFLSKLKNIANAEKQLSEQELNEDNYVLAKSLGFLDSTIERLSGEKCEFNLSPSYKMVDTCAAEFDAQRPYFYSAWDEDNEAQMFHDSSFNGKKKILVLGSGPVSIGSGSELDYCNVNCMKAFKDSGFSTVFVNNNPEAVSTDFGAADRLYTEPLCFEDVANIIEQERPWAVLAQFTGQGCRSLLSGLENLSIKVIGAQGALVSRVSSEIALITLSKELNIPFRNHKFFKATVVDTDVICDGESCLIPGIVEHIEKIGINPADSISVYPAVTVSQNNLDAISQYAEKIAKYLDVKGIVNIRFVIYDSKVYLSGVSFDMFYNIPFLTKVTGIPVIQIAAKCMLGEKLSDLPYGTGVYQQNGLSAVRVPVFSFAQLQGTDIKLGEEAKSTGEVTGISNNFEDALLKALTASGMRLKRSGGVLITVSNSDKPDCIRVAEGFLNLDFKLFSTSGTAKKLNSNFVATSTVRKIHEGSPNTLDLINSGKIVYVISTSEKDNEYFSDDVIIRRRALERQIPIFAAIETADALAHCLAKKRAYEDVALIDITKI